MMSDIVDECRRELSEKFLAWLDRNREKIGEKWYEKLLDTFRKAKINSNIAVFAASLWMLNMINNLGVMASVGLDGYEIHEMRSDLDRKTTEDLLKVIAKCFTGVQLI